MIQADAQAKIEAELAHAEQARASGNEGMARVCARRAAGIAVREFFLANGQPVGSTSAVDLLEQLRSETTLPEDIRSVADHLLQRVTPEYQLPIQADLVAETAWLVAVLQDLPYTSNTSPD